MSLFETDTAVESRGGDRFGALVTDRWNGLAGRPLGGCVLAVCLRALREAMPMRDLFAASAFFLHPVDPGPVEVRAGIARAGRRSATGEARLYQGFEAWDQTGRLVAQSRQLARLPAPTASAA